MEEPIRTRAQPCRGSRLLSNSSEATMKPIERRRGRQQRPQQRLRRQLIGNNFLKLLLFLANAAALTSASLEASSDPVASDRDIQKFPVSGGSNFRKYLTPVEGKQIFLIVIFCHLVQWHLFYVSKRYNRAEENLLLLKGYKCDTLPVHPGPSSDDH